MRDDSATIKKHHRIPSAIIPPSIEPATYSTRWPLYLVGGLIISWLLLGAIVLLLAYLANVIR